MQNTLYTGDNLYILNGMNSDSVDLIYLDPPFNSKRTYSAPIGSKAMGAEFKDIWTWSDVDAECLNALDNHPALIEYIYSIGRVHGKAMMSYITYMTQRIIELHRILKQTGGLYLHIDPTASHYLKIVLDEVFGKNGFRNEIIWHYYNGTSNVRSAYVRKHDVILFYAKDASQLMFDENAAREPYAEDSNFVKNPDSYQDKYKPNPLGKRMHDVWRIPTINNMAKERTGYPTQKPLALLKRIIKASSKEGDVVFDPFCGCATTCVAAQQLQRKWIGIDIEAQAAELLVQRLSEDGGMFKDFIHTDKIPHRTDIKIEKPSVSIKERLFKAQKGACKGCAKHFDAVNFEIDHIIPKSKGGGDYYENFQLLCGNCNRVKGDRPMEELVAKLRAREGAVKKVSY